MGGILSGYIAPEICAPRVGDNDKLMLSEGVLKPMLVPLCCYCCGQESSYLETQTTSYSQDGGNKTKFFCRGCIDVTSDKLDYILDKLKERAGWRFLQRCSDKARDDEHITYFYQKSLNMDKI